MVANNITALAERVRKNLEILYLQLEVVQSGLIVAAQALRYQDAEYDVEIARVLEYGVGDRLHVQLGLLSEIVGELRTQEGDEGPPERGEMEGPALQ